MSSSLGRRTDDSTKMSESTPRASATFSRVMSKGSLSLSRFASNVGPPQMEELKLTHVLNGETCPPISFADFAAFVAHQEYTTENLLFVVWYRNYRARFEALNCRSKAAIPIPSTRLGDRFTPFAYLDKAIAERKAAGLDRPQTLQPDGGISFDQLIRVDSRHPKQKKSAKSKTESLVSTGTGLGSGSKSCAWNPDDTCGISCKTSTTKPNLLTRLASRTSLSKDSKSNGAPSILHSTLYPPLPPPGTVFTSPESQPMRAEAQRAFATFLRKGGSRELGISDELREFAGDCLKRSTAPDCFLPIYEEIYQAVETQSLPRFLASAKRNINRPKELFWYAVGVADLFIGVIMFLIMTLLLPSHPFGWRALRLTSTIFVSFGFMQAYSAYRGFCSQVWGRSNRQVRPWEMDQMDDEEIRLGSVASVRNDLDLSTGERVAESEGESKLAISVDEGSLKEMELVTDGETSAKEGGSAHEIGTTYDHHSHDGELPAGVHALSDVGGYVDYSLDSPANQSPKTVSPSIALPVLEREDGLSALEVPLTSKRQKTIGGNTRVLDVSDEEQRIRRASRREISPFEVEYEPRSNVHGHGNGAKATSATNAKTSRNGNKCSLGTNTRPMSQLEVEVDNSNSNDDDDRDRAAKLGELARKTSRDLSMLLNNLRRASHVQPCSSGVGRERSRSTVSNTNGQGGEGGGGDVEGEEDLFTLNLLELDKKPRIFGPERLIEDPRVKRLMSSIVRDIMVVGLITGSLWIIPCFAVPCRGLA